MRRYLGGGPGSASEVARRFWMSWVSEGAQKEVRLHLGGGEKLLGKVLNRSSRNRKLCLRKTAPSLEVLGKGPLRDP
jgi:hypothetical protein